MGRMVVSVLVLLVPSELLIPALSSLKASRSPKSSFIQVCAAPLAFKCPFQTPLLLRKASSYLNIQLYVGLDVEMLPRYQDGAPFSEIPTVLLCATVSPFSAALSYSLGEVEEKSQDLSM